MATKTIENGDKLEQAKRLGTRLRTLLKLPQAHRWACYEWFTANIDKTLLSGENDFCACLRETFPSLKTRKLARTEWCKIRRLMGKPRRCSQAFLAEERSLLANKRQKLRQLQQQKVVDVSNYRDLPDQIPMSLVIGTKVTALLHEPQDGLFLGIIDAVDTASHGYRITFDKLSVGTHTVPDYEVLSCDPPEFLPLNSFQTQIKPRAPILKSPRFLEILGHQVTEALNGGNLVLPENEDTTTSRYSIKLLALMVRVSKILSIKKKRIYELKSMNDEVERLYSLDHEIPIELKRSYASIIMDLEKLNANLGEHLRAVQNYSTDIPADNCIADPNLIRQRCDTEAKEILDNLLPDYGISNEASISSLTHMTMLMYHLKSLSETEDNALQLKALEDTVTEYKSKLEPNQIPGYEDNVEIHINYIKKMNR